MNTLSNNTLDALELQIRKEQEPYKKGLKPGLLDELREILDNCFKMPKEKKENFITRSKIALDLLKLFQSQKKFKNSDNIYDNITCLGAYLKTTGEIGKIMNINLAEKMVEVLTYEDYSNKRSSKQLHFRDVSMFDYNSPQFDIVYKDYKVAYNNGLSYLEMFNFVSNSNFVNISVTPLLERGYGEEVEKAEEVPAIQEIIETYGIPEEIVRKPKKKLYRLNPDTMEVMEEYDSVKEAAEKMNISASTISNVLCQGKSALKYLDAGNFKWSYSDQSNAKYDRPFVEKTQEEINPSVYSMIAGQVQPAGNYTLHL